jgi:hypothetical protein
MSSRQRLGRVVAPVIRRIGARTPAVRNYLIRALIASPALDIPPLEARHLDNAQLFANRYDLISSMRCIEGGVIAEVGVARGDFSEFLIDQLKPKRFVAFDLFNMHEWSNAWGIPTAEYLNNMTHLEFYKRRFADRSAEVVIEVGMSHLTMAKYPNKSFDLIYIDGDHSYDGVKKDIEIAKNKVADNGVLIFNDYLAFSPWEGVVYGVMRAVNELIVRDDWVVTALAFNHWMHHDVMLRKR